MLSLADLVDPDAHRPAPCTYTGHDESLVFFIPSNQLSRGLRPSKLAIAARDSLSALVVDVEVVSREVNMLRSLHCALAKSFQMA